MAPLVQHIAESTSRVLRLRLAEHLLPWAPCVYLSLIITIMLVLLLLSFSSKFSQYRNHIHQARPRAMPHAAQNMFAPERTTCAKASPQGYLFVRD
jgi:hypothetical protein